MNKRVGSSTVGGGWGFPTQRAGVGGDNKVRKSGPASFDPRTAPLPEQGVIERIDPDQRRRQMVWELEEDLPSPARFAQLMAEFMACAQRGEGDDELDESRLSANEKERLNRMLADEAALIEMMRRTERLRLEVRARAVSERAS